MAMAFDQQSTPMGYTCNDRLAAILVQPIEVRAVRLVHSRVESGDRCEGLSAIEERPASNNVAIDRFIDL